MQAVCILVECILVFSIFCGRIGQKKKVITCFYHVCILFILTSGYFKGNEIQKYFDLFLPSLHSSVGRASAWSHTVSSPTNACWPICGREQLSCHTGYQEVSRCCTRGESQGRVTGMLPPSVNKGTHSKNF